MSPSFKNRLVRRHAVDDFIIHRHAQAVRVAVVSLEGGLNIVPLPYHLLADCLEVRGPDAFPYMTPQLQQHLHSELAGSPYPAYLFCVFQEYHPSMPGTPPDRTQHTLSSPLHFCRLLHKTIVMTQNKMRLDLLNRIEADAYDDKQGGPAKIEGGVEFLDQYRRQHADKRYVDGAGKGDSGKYSFNIVGRSFCRAGSPVCIRRISSYCRQRCRG